ncbi:hypothetical protein O6H91_Y206700 [Diphasiastrum complanatum]|nr:hypothetical protein O6H91_Y206700 [Diphasiastrum complanatum]
MDACQWLKECRTVKSTVNLFSCQCDIDACFWNLCLLKREAAESHIYTSKPVEEERASYPECWLLRAVILRPEESVFFLLTESSCYWLILRAGIEVRKKLRI